MESPPDNVYAEGSALRRSPIARAGWWALSMTLALAAGALQWVLASRTAWYLAGSADEGWLAYAARCPPMGGCGEVEWQGSHLAILVVPAAVTATLAVPYRPVIVGYVALRLLWLAVLVGWAADATPDPYGRCDACAAMVPVEWLGDFIVLCAVAIAPWLDRRTWTAR